MNELELLDEQDKPKVYSGTMLALATFFGSPLVGGYLFTENCKVLGQGHLLRPAWVGAVIATVGSIAVLYSNLENSWADFG